MSHPAATTSASRRGLWRWSVALVATVALVVSGSGLVVFAANGDAEAKGPQFVGADAPIYLEARADLPGDQREAVAQMLTAFPLFADANSFDMKVDEAVDGLVEQATGGAITFSGELENVITGEIGLAVPSLDALMMGGDPEIIVGIAHNDAAAAESYVTLMTAAAADAGDVAEEAYGDTTILVDPTTAVAVTDEWVLLSPTVEQVQAAIDVLDGTAPSLADDADFQTAFARLPSPRLVGAYVDFSAFGSIFELAGMMAEGQAGVSVPTADLMAQLPVNMTASLSAEADRLNLHAFITPGESTPNPPVGESDLASYFPAETQVYLETRNLGSVVETTLVQLVDAIAAQEGGAELGGTDLAEIELLLAEDSPITSLLGVPVPEFFDFVGDASIGAALSSDGVSLGMAAVVEDDELASSRVERLLSIVRLAGAGQETGIAIDSVTVGGAEATTITLPPELLGEAGLPFPVDNTITVAVSDGRLLLGLGDFVETALTQASVTSST